MTIGRKLRQRRISFGMTVPKVAARAGLSSQTVYLIESGETPGKLDTLDKLARALGCTLHIDLRLRRKR